jgi:uncharacterized metal-binding protein
MIGPDLLLMAVSSMILPGLAGWLWYRKSPWTKLAVVTSLVASFLVGVRLLLIYLAILSFASSMVMSAIWAVLLVGVAVYVWFRFVLPGATS